MLTAFHALIHNPVFLAAVSGAAAAARIDYLAFQSFKSPGEAVAYSWKTASFRWLQGAVAGVVSAYGLGLV